MDVVEGGVGTFGVVVWPVYVGALLEDTMPPHTISEPVTYNGSGYRRAAITWEPVPDDRQLVGRAMILLPPGRYTHFGFFVHPSRPQTVGVTKMDQALDLRQVTQVEVWPIINGALALSTMQEVHP